MRFLFRSLLLISGFLFLSILSTGNAFASDFTAEYEVDYTLHPDSGSTHVKQQITLINKQPNLRASSYSLTLDNSNYKNLKAYDSGGALATTETKKDDSVVLTFTFNDKVVGVGSSLKWTIEYDSTTLAKRHGMIWDIAIPRVEEHDSYDISTYTARLIVPKSAGEAHYITPTASNITTNGDYNVYTFTKDKVIPTGIVAAFGRAQVFSFTLKYHLHNPNIGQASTEIALPPDIPGHQQIIFNELYPEAVSIRTDADGNTLATYYLDPNESLDVTFTGWARIDARYPELKSSKTKKDIPSELVEAYTKEQKYWEISDSELIKKVEEITDPEKPVVENARAIYDYVTATLKYNTERINEDLHRMGASEAFRNPNDAVCMEFTDLFVTMARIAGIPAREIDGYAYTTDSNNHPIFYPGLGSDILHAWAQIYLPDDGWVMVDPTWGSTTGGIDFFGRIDLNRIAFAIKGISSQTPYAAGSYKTNDSQDGDVSVTFSQEDKTGSATMELALDRHSLITGIGSSLPVKITNTGNVAIYDIDLTAESQSPLKIGPKPDIGIARILPGQTITGWIPAESEGWFDSDSTKLHVSAMGKDFYQKEILISGEYDIEVKPFLTAVILPIVLVALIVGLLIGVSWFALHKLHIRHDVKPEDTIAS